MKHKVLILGTLGEFTELVKKAKEKGYETVVCDGYADGIARTYADKAYTIPVTDVDAIALMCREEGVTFYHPSPILCTDNAAMIGAAAYYDFIAGKRSGLDLNAVPNLKLGES